MLVWDDREAKRKLVNKKDIAMNEREIECSRCDNATIMIQDDIPSGWVFVETGWAIVDSMKLCPECKKYYLKPMVRAVPTIPPTAKSRVFPFALIYCATAE